MRSRPSKFLVQAKYSLPGSVGGEFCGAHKLPGMARVNTRHCEDCDKRATFGLTGARAWSFRVHGVPNHKPSGPAQ